jgi:hypothetical protein
MRQSSRISGLLKTGGFAAHYYLGRWLKIGFAAQCFLVAGISVLVILASSVLDRTLLLHGRDVGLLEHPAIWAFFILQIALPLAIGRSLQKLSNSGGAFRRPTQPELEFAATVLTKLTAFMRLRDWASRAVAAICYTTGLIAFVWNTYQNQLPGIVVPYDFWDSSNHLLGYWTTRVYKFYLFVWFLPYIALIHSAVLIVTLRLLRERRTAGALTLQPFHPDGAGGLGFVPGLVTTPIIVTALTAALPVAGAFEVHRAADITPIMGVTIVVAGALIAYVVPILYLRTDIVALKREAVEKLRLLQQSYYSQIAARKEVEFETLRRGNEALDYFDKICARVQSISNYPHLTRLLKYIGLALTPSVASLILKLYETFGPLIIPLLRRP